MKKICFRIVMPLIVLLLIGGKGFAAKSLFVYVDPSSISDRLGLIEKVKEQLSGTYDNYILFISNMDAPIISSNASSMNQALKKLLHIQPSGLQNHNEIDTLISILGPLVGQGSDMEYVFFFDETQCRNNRYVNRFAGKLLLVLGDQRRDLTTVYVNGDPSRLIEQQARTKVGVVIKGY